MRLAIAKTITLTLTAILALGTATTAQSQTKVDYQAKGLTITGNKGFKLSIQNTYTFDGVAFVPAFDTSKVTKGDDPFTLRPNLMLSNLQTKLSGSFSKRWGYEFHVNYASNKIKMLNMLLYYYLAEGLKLRIGQMKVPGSMTKNYSTGAVMSLADPIGLSLVSSRRLGVGLFHATGHSYAALGLYTFNLNDYIGTGLPKQPEIGVAARFTYNLINKRHEKLLLGGNAYWMRSVNGLVAQSGQFSLETSAVSTRLLYYSHPSTKSQLNYGLEMAYQNRRFLFTLEGLGTHFFRAFDLSTPQYAGWNLRASYTLLGKPRSYSSGSGDFSGTSSDGKSSLVVGLRSSGLYLNDHLETEALMGVSYGAFANYWTTSHLCFSLQASYLDHHKDFVTGYHVADTARFSGLDLLLFQGRITILF